VADGSGARATRVIAGESAPPFRTRHAPMPHTPPLTAALLVAALASSLAASLAAPPSLGAQTTAGAAPVRVDLARDRVGREPTSFVPMVGNWVVTSDEGRKVVMVDGRAWKRGQPAGGLADRARAIYGARHEEFIDNVKAFAYFPIAVARDVPDFHDGDVSLKFKMIAGTLDRCAGILFDVKPNGDYLAVRFNGTEDNVVLWTFNAGKRSFVKRGAENFPLELGTWHELRASVHGTDFKAYLDGKLVLEQTLKAPVSGKVGLWSKTDSMSEFADFVVTPAAR
jgi:hypothetical protein